MEVYESMETDAVAINGILPLPASYEELLGGHAVLIVCSDNTKKVFIVRNSWGVNFEDKGYFYMPYTYFQNYTFDYWVLTS